MFLIMMMETGQVVVIAAGSYLSYQIVSVICGALPILFFVTFYWFPESPYFYLRKGDVAQAKKCLQRLRYGDVNHEFMIMTKSVEEEMSKKSSLKDVLFDKEYRKEIGIVIGEYYFTNLLNVYTLLKK